MSSLVRAYLFFYTSLGKNDSYIEIRVTGNWDEPLQRRSNNLYAILCRYTKLKTSWWKDLHLCIKRLGFGCSYAHFTYLNRIKNCQLYHHRQWKSRQIILDFRSKIKIWALIRKKKLYTTRNSTSRWFFQACTWNSRFAKLLQMRKELTSERYVGTNSAIVRIWNNRFQIYLAVLNQSHSIFSYILILMKTEEQKRLEKTDKLRSGFPSFLQFPTPWLF